MKITKCLVLLVLLLQIIPLTEAIGIGPSSLKVEPGTTKDYRFFLINNEHKDLYASVRIEQFNPNVLVTAPSTLHATPEEEMKEFHITVTVPSDLDCEIGAKIFLAETSKGSEEGMTLVGVVGSRIVKVGCEPVVTEEPASSFKINWTYVLIGLFAVCTIVIGIILVIKFRKKREHKLIYHQMEL